MTAWLERFQVPLYFFAIAVGAVAALAFGSSAFPTKLVDALLLPLMFVTFLSVPLKKVAMAVQDLRFGAVLLALNFVLVPVVVWLLTRPLVDAALLVGAVLVLVCPCVDYVIVFSRLAGGDADRLVAWAPILLVVQMLAMPLFLWLIAGHSVAASAGPFFYAFRLFIVIPLLAAAIVQRFSGRAVARGISKAGDVMMVPLMMATLAAVVATQTDRVREYGGQLAVLLPIFAGFALVMGAVAWLAAARFFPRPQAIALTFSALTRNSLIIMPFALVIAAVPGLGITPAVVVTQTMVELLVMVLLVGMFRRAS